MNLIPPAIIVGVAALAQNPGAPGRAAEKCVIEGRVVNLTTGEPVRKAHVIASGVDGRSLPGAITDAAGRYTLYPVRGKYRIRAEREGFVVGEYGARSAGRPGIILSLESGQKLTDINLQLTPYSAITGRVTNEDNEPISNVSIYCLEQGKQGGVQKVAPAAMATTNDLGEFRAAGLAPGQYLLAALYRPDARFVADPSGGTRVLRESYAPIFYPGTSDPSGAAPIAVPAGQDVRGIALTVRPAETAHVRGRVVPAGGPGTSTSVRLFPRGSAAFLGAFSASASPSDGTFEIVGVVPGPYTVSVEMHDRTARRGGTEPIDVGSAGLDNLELAVGPGVTLSGQVRIEGEGTIDFQKVRVQPRSDVPTFLESSDGELDRYGSFTLSELLPGSYMVNVKGIPDDRYLKTIKLGDEDVMDSGLRLNRGAARPLSIVLASGAGSIEGTVQDGQNPQPGATVVLTPVRGRHPSRLKTAITDQYGRFALRGIAPGEYKAFALQDVDADIQPDSDLLKRYANAGESLTIAERDQQTVTLNVMAQ